MPAMPRETTSPATAGAQPECVSVRLPRIAHVLFFGSLVAALLVIAVAATMIWQARQDTWERTHRAAENLLQGVIGYMDQHVRLYTLALEFAAETLHSPGARVFPEQAKQDVLVTIVKSTDYVGGIMELDARGNLVRASPVRAERNFSDRDYFIAQRDNPKLGVYIGKPFHSRLRDGDLSIALSRRLDNPDGSFAGVIVIAVRLAYIEAFLSHIDMGPQGALLILNGDGRILIRQPRRERQGAVGSDVSSSLPFRRMQAMGAGSFTARAMVDGVERYYTFAHVPHQTLIVNVALATDDIFDAWRRRAIVTGVITLVTCTLIVLLAVFLRRELYRRAVVEANLAQLSMTDGLTGLANRRCYDEVVRREWARAGRTGASLALLLLDADGFKTLNDRHGHAQGDEVLKALARTLLGCVRRPVDLAARYGGEEFAVVLPDTTGEGALAVAEAIRSGCEQLDVAGLPGFTVSIGVGAICPPPDLAVDRFEEMVDKALYQAKLGGRNRVVLTQSRP